MFTSKFKKAICLLLSLITLVGLVSTSVVTSIAESTHIGRVWQWNPGVYSINVDSDTAVGNDPTQGLFIHYKGNRAPVPKIIFSSWNGGAYSVNGFTEGSLDYIKRAANLKFKISIGQMYDENGNQVDSVALVLRMTVDGVVYTNRSNSMDGVFSGGIEAREEPFAVANFVKADDPSAHIDLDALKNAEITNFEIDIVSNNGVKIKDADGYLLGIDAFEANGNRIGTVWNWTQSKNNFTVKGGYVEDSFVPWDGNANGFGSGAPRFHGNSEPVDAITFTSWPGGCYTESGASIGSLNHVNTADYLQIDYNVQGIKYEDGTGANGVNVTMNLVVGGVNYHNTQPAIPYGNTTLVYKLRDFVKTDDPSVKLDMSALRAGAGKAVGTGYVSAMSMEVSLEDRSNIGYFEAYIIGVDAFASGSSKATFDNGVADIVADDSGKVTLPDTTVAGKQFIGWTDGQNLYKAGDEVELIKDTSFKAVAVALELQTGAGIRWAEREEERGIRFETFVTKATLDTIGSSNFELGALILPFSDYSNDITVDNATSFGAVNVVSPKIYGTTVNGQNYRYYSGVVDFEKYFNVATGTAVADLKLTAVSYIKVKYNDGSTVTLYDHPDATDNVRSVAQVARAALQDTEFGYSADQIAILNLYNKFSVETDVPSYRTDAKDKAKKGDELKICCIGDSLTEGITGNPNNEVTENTYPKYLAQISGAEVINYGRGGYRSTDSLNWYNQGGIDVKGADIIVIMLGTNGGMTLAQNTQQNEDYRTLIQKCREDAPNANIVLCTEPFVSMNYPLGVAVSNNVKDGNAFIRQLVEQENYSFIDVASCPSFTEETVGTMQPIDGVHFSDLGNEVLAQYIYDGLVDNGLIVVSK